MLKALEAPFVRKAANIYDAATRVALEEFSFLNIQNQLTTIVLPRDEASSVNTLTRAILRANGKLPKNQTERNRLIEQAIHSEPKTHLRCASHVGWVFGASDEPVAFIIGKHVIPLASDGRGIRSPSWLDDKMLLPPEPIGNLQDWQSEVAYPAARSSRMGFALMAAFAPPLLAISGRPNFMINFFHKAKVGKSTILLVAASVAGPGEESDLPNWKATLSGGQQTVRAHNDTCFFINETGLIADRKKSYPQIREWIYWLGEGREEIKNSQSVFTANTSSSKFRCVTLSSSEHSFDAFATIAGAERDGGEYARCSDIPTRAEGHDTIFDWHEDGKDTTAEFARAELVRLRNACRLHHGVAIEPYLKYLSRRWNDLPALIKGFVDEFATSIAGDLSDVDHHVAGNFGLIYAAARLAIMAKVLPWPPEHPIHYARECFLAASHAAHATDDLLEAGKRILDEALHGLDRKQMFSPWPDVWGKIGGVRRNGQTVSYVCKTGPFATFSTARIKQVSLSIGYVRRANWSFLPIRHRPMSGRAKTSAGQRSQSRSAATSSWTPSMPTTPSETLKRRNGHQSLEG